MKGVSAAGLCAVGAEIMSGRASAAVPYADEYSTVVNLVEDAGADPNNGDSITPIIRKYADDDTLLYLPSGRYFMDEQVRFTGFNQFGIVGEDDTTIVPAKGVDFKQDDWNFRLFRFGVSYSPGRNLRVENLNIDQRADDTGIRVIDAAISDGLLVRNIDIMGQHDSGTWGPGRFVITDSDGSGIVEGFRAPDGGAWEDNTPANQLWRGPTGIICNQYNHGQITFRNCVLGRFPDNGLYAANGSGQVIVDGGHYKNSQTASLRVGGNNSVIKNAKVVVDKHSDRGNQHAIRVESSNYFHIKDCDIKITDPSGDAIKSMDVGHLRIDGTTIRTSGDTVVNALVLQDRTKMARIKNCTFDHNAIGGFSLKIEGGDKPVYVEKSTFTGDGGDKSARAAIRCDRDNCEFREILVKQMGAKRRRALVNTAHNTLVYGGNFHAQGYPIIDTGNSSWIEGIYAKSGQDDHPGLRLTSSANNTYVKKSHIVNGIQDDSDEVSGWGNDYSI